MKELNWKHIRNSVAITTLVWPFAAFLVFPVLSLLTLSLTLPLTDFAFEGLSTICFCLSVGLSAYMLGNLLSPKRAVLHGVLSAGIAIPTAALLTFLVLSVINFYLYLPSDWWLIRRFERNEAVFNELRDAVQREGGLEFISLERIEPTNFEAVGVSPQQLESYRVAIQNLGLNAISRSRYSEAVYFSLDKLGSNTEKFYLYQKTPPPAEQIVEKIIDDKVTGSTGVYRPIGDGWYLYAEAISD